MFLTTFSQFHSSFTEAVRRLRKRSSAGREVAGTDSWDWGRRTAAEPASVDSLAADADNDADSCSVGRPGPVIEDTLRCLARRKGLEAAGSCPAPDPTLVVDSLDSAATSAALACLTREPAVEHMETAPMWRLVASEPVDWVTLLEIADSTGCC